MKVLRFLTILLAAAGSASVARADWGTLTGQFVLDGAAPAATPVNVTKDEAFCGKHGLVDESISVNSSNNGISGIIVFLSVDRGKKAPTPHPDYESTATAEVRIDNKNCRFEPHVVLLRTGQTLVVGNVDPVGHNSKIDTIKNPPINPIIPANQTIQQVFGKEERLPCSISCSIHPWMKGWVVIKDSPYMAVTDADGKFEIKNLPTGKFKFQAWQESPGYITSVSVGGKKTKWSKGTFEQEIKAGDNDLGEIKVPLASLKK
ncbi:MAG: hypothetical protein KDB23_09925 [Planctomycetales bacterium]|nr:hypothetical protein [Planctomycetales bacterium]